LLLLVVVILTYLLAASYRHLLHQWQKALEKGEGFWGEGWIFCKAFLHGIMSSKQAHHPSSSSSSMDHYPTTRELITPQSKTLQNWSMDFNLLSSILNDFLGFFSSAILLLLFNPQKTQML
jgi:hypothetical protein